MSIAELAEETSNESASRTEDATLRAETDYIAAKCKVRFITARQLLLVEHR